MKIFLLFVLVPLVLAEYITASGVDAGEESSVVKTVANEDAADPVTILTPTTLTHQTSLNGTETNSDLNSNADSDNAESKFTRSVAKTDLQPAATQYGLGHGVGGIGFGQGGFGGHGGGYGSSGGYEGNSGFGGGKSYGAGNNFGADHGGVNKHIKNTDVSFQNNHNAVTGKKGNIAFHGQQGHVKTDFGNVNKANKKGQFGTVGHFSKAAKNDGTVYGKNNAATKYSKGTKFGTKGAHKKGHSTKGFRNIHHKDEFSKNHQFHDEDNTVDFFDKFGDEGAFKNDVAGKQFFNGHHANVLNKNNQANEGTFLSGHHNIANKGNNAQYGNKGQNANTANYGQYGGQNYAHGFGKGLHANNNYGGTYGGGFGDKQGRFGGTSQHGGFGGSVGGYGGHGGAGFGGYGYGH